MAYAFDDQLLDPDARELVRSGVVVELEPQAFDVLAHLVTNRHRVVPKEELLDEVWGDRFVSESALTTRIKQVRQAVGDDGRTQRVVKTVHGRGYRFIADVTEPAAGKTPPEAEMGSGLLAAHVPNVPTTSYARSDGASIAYQTFGEGPDLVLIAGFTTNVELQWEHPQPAAFLQRLSSFARVTVLDKRGVGLSDRIHGDDPPSLETRSDDLLSVMEAAGVESATILGSSEGGALSTVFTATHPERVDRLILHGTFVRHPEGPDRTGTRLQTEKVWGTGAVYSRLAPQIGSTPAGRRFLARYERQSASPMGAGLLQVLSGRFDIGDVLSAVAVPTLILHRRADDWIPFSCAVELAEGIPGARLVDLDGVDHYLFSGDTTRIVDEIEQFVTGSRGAAARFDRQLATVLFTDIVGSTVLARDLRDARWAARLDEFHQTANRILVEHRAQLVNSTGDGLVATFDGPGRAVMAARSIRAETAPLGLTLRCGLHTAEIERRGDDIAGIGVHIASRVADVAGPGEIWVSRTLTDLVAGTGLELEGRGHHELKGVGEPWMLYEVRG